MNRQDLRKKSLTVATAILTMMLASNIWAAKNIQLQVVNQGGGNILVTNDKLCPGSSENGCIQMDRGQGDTIKYVLPRSYKCGEGDSGNWDITAVQLSMTNKAWGSPLPAFVGNDFNVNLSNGFINFQGGGAAVDVSNGNTSEYDIWYRVLATCTSTGEQIELDPRVKNTG